MSKSTAAWDPDKMGFGKHDYHSIDPDEINPDDYARNLRGDEAHFGDIRQYNSAENEKHPENTIELDMLGRPDTIFYTEAKGYEGNWIITRMPVVRSPITYCRASRCTEEGEVQGEETLISCVDLGCAVDETNNFHQVLTRLVRKAKVNKATRKKLTAGKE